MMHDRNGAIIGTSHMTERHDLTEAEWSDKLAALALIAPTVAAWVASYRATGLTWPEIQAKWRTIELIILGDRKKVH